MDPTSRFVAALALASASMVPLGSTSGASANEQLSETEMYQRCKQGSRFACERFLSAYPSSVYASDVLGSTVDKMAGDKMAGGLDHERHVLPSTIY